MFGQFRSNYKAHKWALLFCAISAIGALVYGYDNTYYNGVLAMQTFKNHYGDHLDENGKKALKVSFTSLSASSIYIGDLFGALFSAPINDRYGRKVTFWFASVSILIGGIIQVADTNYEALIVVGRIIIGLGVGAFTVTSLLYIGEVAPVQIRGPSLMMFQFLQSCSQLIAAGLTQGTEKLSSTLSYKLPMGGLIILPLMMFIGLPFIPESPVWFGMKGRKEEAERALRAINRSNKTYDPSDDLAMLEDARAREQETAAESSWRALLVNPIERKKVIWSAGALYAQQICGILFFYVYGVVFAQAIGIKEPFMIQLATNILQIFAVAAAVITGNKIRRRTNLLATTSLMLIAFLVIGGIGTQQDLTTSSQYVIVVFSFVVIVAFNFGLGPLAYTVAREMAVGTNQNKIMSMSIVIFYFTTWAVSFSAPYMYYSAGLGPMLGFVYAGTTLTSLAYIYFCVGETTGRTNDEISLLLASNVPARRWRTHVFPEAIAIYEEKDRSSSSIEGKEQVEHFEPSGKLSV
ncbi:High-affinity glucose transporter ght5 [Venustampulla echinocandica]|uniref:High-affinity glucose transporter ght5 n=1 Tax=Venustampulla echinocandica TaxID=2656787 RepID=A0A370TXA5_9HELO|nr:High-affinity glucose transporter ght5 [Venustampulla echinocandica]RDL40118.1 High-affinity glucose transporter ght5 [Venustampulla echinocandica]